MPFPSMTEGDFAILRNDDEFYKSCEQLRQQGEKEELPITNSVATLERKYNTLQIICGEMLSTLQLESNAHLFKNFPQDWHTFVEDWSKRYEREANEQ